MLNCRLSILFFRELALAESTQKLWLYLLQVSISLFVFSCPVLSKLQQGSMSLAEGFECTSVVSSSNWGTYSANDIRGLFVPGAGLLPTLVGVRVVVDDIESGA